MRAIPASARHVLLIAGLVLSWFALVPRLIPDGSFEDTGVFWSVADRLVAGDVLYAGVWDNKDPLFYLTLAAGRAVSPFAPTLLEVLWVACAAASAQTIAAWGGVRRGDSFLIGWLVTPLILTGAFYSAGYSHLPGIALTLLALALSVNGRPFAAGLVVGLVPFFKILLGPVVLVVVIVALAGHRWKGLRATVIGAAVASAGVLGLLAVRGELLPYLDSLRLNVAYTSALGDDAGAGVVGHVRRVLAVPGAWTVLLSILLVLLIAAALRERQPSADRRPGLLWACAAGASAAALVVLALTGLWYHHLQVLYVPAVLCLLAAASACGARLVDAGLLGLAGGVVAALLLAGATPTVYGRAMANLPRALASQASVAPLSSALLSTGRPGTYARVGIGDHDVHAHGLGAWRLVCARFHQYPFDPDQALTELTACLPTADVLLVSDSAVVMPGATTWNAYLGRVESLLAADYTCETHEGGRLCRRVSS